jgi:hypothetical protein
MAKQTYRQCRLTKPIAGGVRVQVSWIPSRHAVVGKMIRIRDDEGAWDDGWLVESAWATEVSEEEVNRLSRLYTRNRKATDI